MSESK